MSNDTAKTITTNIVPVQGTFEPLPPYECINLIGPAGTPFYAPVNPDLDGVSITNSTINSSTIGATTPSTGAFTNIATTTGSITSPPSGPNSIVNQAYVDSVAQGLAFKQPAVYKSTGNLTLSGLGVQAGGDWASSLTAGMRILVTDQSAPAENGIYVASSSTWTRSSDANTWDELIAAYLFVTSGATWAGSSWVNTNQPGGTLGVTAVTFIQFSNNATYTAGTGLTLAGFQFSITNTGVSAATYGSASTVPAIAVNAQGQITSATNTSIAIDASAITSGTINTARISGDYSGITGVGTLTNLTVSNTISGSISGNAATATSATSATTATNLAGGATGSVPYQSAAGTTTFVGIGSTGQILTVSGGVPTWAAPASSGDVTGPASSTDNAIARFDSTTGKIIQNSGITLSDANALQNVNEINFDITPVGVVGGAGSGSWNSDDNTQTLEIIGNNNVPIKVGEENYYRIKASSAITKGQVLMFTGTLGSSGGLTAAPATGLTAATGSLILGVAKESASTNGWIYVQEFGEVKGIDTSGTPVGETWANGDILYYNPAVTGGLTKTVPTAPNAKVQVAAVVHADNTNGILFVRPTFEPRLNDLSNVNAPSPTDGDVIVWDNTDLRWENRAQSSLVAGSATNLAGGATGSLPYQSGAGATTFLAAGSDGQVLKLASGVPTWSSDTSGVTITDDTTTNATRYITFSNLTTGNETTLDVSSTKLQFNPSTGALTATSLTPTNALSASFGGTGQTSLTANNVILGNGTSGVQFVAPGTAGNVLTSNGTTWTSAAAGGGFDAGTRLIFAQNTAPTGWTKDTTNYNNHALRIVTGTGGVTGGTVDFTTAFTSQSVTGSVASTGSSTVSGTSDATTLSTSQIPSHQHTIAAYTDNATQGPRPRATDNTTVQGTPTTGPCGSTGGGSSHTHSFTSSGHTHTSGAFTGNAINLAVKYLDVITATKN